MTIIGAREFAENQLGEVILPSGLISISDDAFYKNNLKVISIPDSVTSIGYSAFESNQLLTAQFLGDRPNFPALSSRVFQSNAALNLITYCSDRVGWPGEAISNGLTDITPVNDCDADGIGNNADDDDDGDGVIDVNDTLPFDPTNDTDGDGIPNNVDSYPENGLYSKDSDGDGMPDAWEIKYGLDPSDSSDATSDQDNDGVLALDEFLAGTIPSGSIDLDGNGEYDALTDGLLLLRGMFGLDGNALTGGTLASNAT